MIHKLTWNYFYLFFQSNVIEIPFYYFGLKNFVPGPLTRSLTDSERMLFFLVSVTAINSLTHPLIFFGIMNLKLSYLTNILFAEIFAIVAEGLLVSWMLQNATKKRAIGVAAIANLISWQLGPLLTFKIFS